MKTILLMRHAKSDWGEPGLADFDRPLAKRGLTDAPRMGEALALYETVPDKILASPARRAKQTAKLMAEACGYRKSIQWEENFYGGTSGDLIGALQRLPDTVQRAMLVGHNPTMEETAAHLLAGEGEGWGTSMAVQMPTAALLCLDVHIVDWAALQAGEGILRWYIIPKLVQAIS